MMHSSGASRFINNVPTGEGRVRDINSCIIQSVPYKIQLGYHVIPGQTTARSESGGGVQCSGGRCTLKSGEKRPEARHALLF